MSPLNRHQPTPPPTPLPITVITLSPRSLNSGQYPPPHYQYWRTWDNSYCLLHGRPPTCGSRKYHWQSIKESLVFLPLDAPEPNSTSKIAYAYQQASLRAFDVEGGTTSRYHYANRSGRSHWSCITGTG